MDFITDIMKSGENGKERLKNLAASSLANSTLKGHRHFLCSGILANDKRTIERVRFLTLGFIVTGGEDGSKGRPFHTRISDSFYPLLDLQR